MNKDICLPPKTCYLWQIRLSVSAFVISLLFLLLCKINLWMLIPFICISVFFALLILWYVPLFIKSYRITANENAFTVKMGVFLKTTYIMPYPRLIYVTTIASPIARCFKICGVVIRAARGFILIPEMQLSDVEKIYRISMGENNGKKI